MRPRREGEGAALEPEALGEEDEQAWTCLCRVCCSVVCRVCARVESCEWCVIVVCE